MTDFTAGLSNSREFTSEQIAQIADDYAVAKAAFDAAKEALDAVKALVDETGRAELVGSTFRLDVNIFERAALDAAAAKKFLTEEQIKSCTKVSTVRTIKVKAAVELKVKTTKAA